MLAGTVSYSLLLGIGMVAIGHVARQRWLAYWSATLVFVSAAFRSIQVMFGEERVGLDTL